MEANNKRKQKQVKVETVKCKRKDLFDLAILKL